MAVASIASSTTGSTGGISDTLTISHTQTNNVLLVLVSCYWTSGSARVIDSITYNGAFLDFVAEAGGTFENASIWVLKSPASGTHSLVITASDLSTRIQAIVLDIADADPVTPTGDTKNYAGSAASVSKDYTSLSGDLVVDIVATGQGWPFTCNASQTSIGTYNDGPLLRWAGESKKAGAAGTTTMAWTCDGGHLTTTAYVGAVIKVKPLDPSQKFSASLGPDFSLNAPNLRTASLPDTLPDVFRAIRAHAGTETPLIYVELDLVPTVGPMQVYRWSEAGKDCGAGAAHLDGRLLSFASINRALSDFRGVPEAQAFGFDVSDNDQLISGLLAGATTKYFTGREVIAYATTLDRHIAGLSPVTVVRGAIRRNPSGPERRLSFAAVDPMTSDYGAFSGNNQVPRRTIPAALVVDSDAATTFKQMVGRVEPIRYGDLTSIVHEGLVVVGTLAVSVDATKFKTTTEATFAIADTTYTKAATDLLTFSAANTINTAAAAGQFWGAWLVEIGVDGTVHTKPAGGLADQVYTTEALAIAALPDVTTSHARLGYITIRTKAATSWTANTDDMTAGSDCAAVNFYDWPVVSKVGRVWPIPVSWQQYSGTWYLRCLVAAHACKAVPTAYVDGADAAAYVADDRILLPDLGNWASFFATPYADISGRRYTFVYLKEAVALTYLDGSHPVTVDVQGVEDVGDGSGTLLTSLTDIYRHALKNFLVGDWQTGAWLAAPVSSYGSTMIDEDSFDTAKTDLGGRGVSYTGCGSIEEQTVLSEWIARFNNSCDVNSAFTPDGKFFVCTDEGLTSVWAFDELDLIAGEFKVEPQDDQFANVIVLNYQRDSIAGQWLHEGFEVVSDSSVATYQKRKPDQAIDLYFVDAAALAENIGANRLRRRKDPVKKVTIPTGLYGLQIPLGAVVTVSTREAQGGPWVNRKVRVERTNPALDRYQVTLEGKDRDAEEASPTYTTGAGTVREPGSSYPPVER